MGQTQTGGGIRAINGIQTLPLLKLTIKIDRHDVAISKKIRLSEILEYDLRTVDLECLYMYVHKESLYSDGEQFHQYQQN